MCFKGINSYNNSIKNIAIGVLFLVIAEIFLNSVFNFILVLFFIVSFLVFFFTKKYITEFIVEDRIKIYYVIFFQHKKKEFDISEKTRFYLQREMVYRRSEPNYYVKIMEGNKQLYKISSEVNFDIDTIMNLWDYLTINYPSNVVKPNWRIPLR